MKKEGVIIVSTLLLLLLSFYGYMQFGEIFVIEGGALVAGVLLINQKSILFAKIINLLFSILLLSQSFSYHKSGLVNYGASCLDVCIGQDLPIYLFRFLAVVSAILMLAVVAKQFVEKK